MRGRRIAALAAALLAVASTAHALPPPNYTGAKQNPDSTAANVAAGFSADSIKHSLKMLSDGTAVVSNQTDAALLEAAKMVGSPFQTRLRTSDKDSTGVYATAGWTHQRLYIFYTVNDSSVATSRPYTVTLFIEPRGHLTPTADSTSAYRWLMTKQATAQDTVGSFRDSIAFRPTAFDGSNGVIGALPSEFFVTFPGVEAQANANGNARGVFLDLVNTKTGEWFWAPYTSYKFRAVLRNLSGVVMTPAQAARVYLSITPAGIR